MAEKERQCRSELLHFGERLWRWIFVFFGVISSHSM